MDGCRRARRNRSGKCWQRRFRRCAVLIFRRLGQTSLSTNSNDGPLLARVVTDRKLGSNDLSECVYESNPEIQSRLMPDDGLIGNAIITATRRTPEKVT